MPGLCRCSPSTPHVQAMESTSSLADRGWRGCHRSWSAELTEQAIARIYRPGQTQRVTIHVCVAADTVDEMKRDRVLGKMSAQEAFKRHLERV